MIDVKVIQIAADTRNYGLNKKFTHSATQKNKVCGDKISIEINVRESKIKSMRYETESCVYCQASASILSNFIRNSSINDLKKDISKIDSMMLKDKVIIPNKLRAFKLLFHNNNRSRFNCVMLPFNALRKALNI